MSYLIRDHNVITKEKTLEPLYTFKNFPGYIGCTDKAQKNDILADLSLTICKKTGIIQLDKLLPLEVVYPEYHSEALGGVWRAHHMRFVKFINKYNPQNVLEIGGSNGFIALECLKNKKIKKWIMVEPTPSIKSNKRFEVIPTNFNNSFKYNKPIDMVVHSHTLEHIYEPGDFMEAIGRFLQEDGLQIFSVPNLYRYLKNKYANWINFEHTVFLTEYYIDYLLTINGFEIIEKKYYLEHSIFYATKKSTTKKKIFLKNKYKKNKKLFNDFLTFYQKKISLLNKKIKNFDGEVYLFGGHIFSQFLLNLRLDSSIKKILDNSKLKRGKRLYGTNLSVAPLEVIKDLPRVAVILKAGVYQYELTKQLKRINNNVVIWE
jgi:SAM-dependent methyltransferase